MNNEALFAILLRWSDATDWGRTGVFPSIQLSSCDCSTNLITNGENEALSLHVALLYRVGEKRRAPIFEQRGTYCLLLSIFRGGAHLFYVRILPDAILVKCSAVSNLSCTQPHLLGDPKHFTMTKCFFFLAFISLWSCNPCLK